MTTEDENENLQQAAVDQGNSEVRQEARLQRQHGEDGNKPATGRAPRKRFGLGSGNTPAIGWHTFQQCENAIRCDRINVMLDSGKRVFGDDGKDEPGTWHEIEEAVEPMSHGLYVKTKDGRRIRIYAYDASDARQ